MKQSTGVALVVFMTAGALSLRSCDQSDCRARPDQARCQSSGGHGGGYYGGGGSGGSDEAGHGVSTGGFGESAGGHGGGGGE